MINKYQSATKCLNWQNSTTPIPYDLPNTERKLRIIINKVGTHKLSSQAYTNIALAHRSLLWAQSLRHTLNEDEIIKFASISLIWQCVKSGAHLRLSDFLFSVYKRAQCKQHVLRVCIYSLLKYRYQPRCVMV